MTSYDIYEDIAERTNGDIYIGVVGPVRTGKSTFIKRFMDMLVLPGVKDDFERTRLVDELPQSAAGRTIMTTQPRFVPNEAVTIELGEKARPSVRMVDCVGYMVDGALGSMEDDAPRMVMTPWADEAMPFEKAAELGTFKVISDHSTIGIVMTTDGSITDLPRGSYVEPEERVIRELKDHGKPFVIVLNSAQANSPEAEKMRDMLLAKYNVPVLLIDVLNMSVEDINSLLESVLFEFPLQLVRFSVPTWVRSLGNHNMPCEVIDAIAQRMDRLTKVRDYTAVMDMFDESENFSQLGIQAILLGRGEIVFDVVPREGMFYRVLSDECGYEIADEGQLMRNIKDLTKAKREYDRLSGALDAVRKTGYGMIPPIMDELVLREPEMIRRGNQFGVKLRAECPSIHMIRADVHCEVSPIVGTEKQSEELVEYLLSEFDNDPAKIWETNIFGKSLHDLVKEGVSGKLMSVPEDVREKLQETLQRIINEGSGSLICILL